MAIALTNFDQEQSRACSVSTHRTLPYSQDRPLSDIATFADCVRRHVDSFVELLAMAASTCVGLPSSVAVFGSPDLLALATEPALLNFVISFTTILWVICFLCIALKVGADTKLHEFLQIKFVYENIEHIVFKQNSPSPQNTF
ncbi:hypothetical protein AVEN_188739-1 [Araneus ventricosus]|uniref:Transmembrane protein n=1 Tax=Araneus ventricosus TaxID=182803 RepID=A0A4Y2U272_ARAVE|nr:hypothetical protein AVEN_188739-1 [Araneus ventricosus]